MVLDLRKLSCKYCFTRLPWWISSLSLWSSQRPWCCLTEEESALSHLNHFSYLPSSLAERQFLISITFLGSTVAWPTQTQRTTVTLKNVGKEGCWTFFLLLLLIHLVCPVFLFISRHGKSWNWIRNGALEERSSV